MNPTSFVREVGECKTGDGFRRDVDLDIRNAYLPSDASALTTTLTTNPGFAVAETNAIVLQWAATKVVAAGIDFPIPGDYDLSKDELRLRLLTQMGGATDTPAFTVNVYSKRKATALTADLGPFTAKAENAFGGPASTNFAGSATAANAIVDISGKGLKPGDVLYIKITPGAHGTDAINVYELIARYRGDLALFNEIER